MAGPAEGRRGRRGRRPQGPRRGGKGPRGRLPRVDEREEVERLRRRRQGPGPGGSGGGSPEPPDDDGEATDAKRFDELPLSQYTLRGLADGGFADMTAIQRAAIRPALGGRDLMGAAKTGSGKTLAFLVPMLELLYAERWGRDDGLGALVVTPTRELALQIFGVLQRMGRHHSFSCGLLIGGNDLAEEVGVVGLMNILVCTPGRLLQHMDQTPNFDCMNLKVLILDEADRLLDMGFQRALRDIMQHLPADRQSMLFSATLSAPVQKLARLSLRDPETVSVHAEAQAATPLKLHQAFVEVELGEKMNTLWGFIKSHLNSKVIVFFSTCKQVKFALEALRHLRPGIPLKGLHGKMKQPKRMDVYYEFSQASSCVLLATDIAARGLDFPEVDWVLQVDCPEDIDAYLHRVGRTARFTNAGRALLLLLPTERAGMVEAFGAARVPIREIKLNPDKAVAATPGLHALMSKFAALKDDAQKALIAYLRSVHLNPNKEVFKVLDLPLDEFAYSLGLMNTPKVKFLHKLYGKTAFQKPRAAGGEAAGAAGPGGGGSQSEGEGEGEEAEAEELGPGGFDAAGGGSDDELLLVKQENVFDVDAPLPVLPSKMKRKKKLKIKKAGNNTGERTVFDAAGRAKNPLEALAASLNPAGEVKQVRLPGLRTQRAYGSVTERMEDAKELMKERDVVDRKRAKELRKMKRIEKRNKLRAREEGEAAPVAVLGGAFSGSGEEEEMEEEGGGAGEGASGSDSESDSPPEKRVRLDPSHVGMAIRKTQPKAIDAMGLDEKEALALQLLA